MNMKRIWMLLWFGLLFVSCFEDQDIQAEYIEYGRHYDVNSPDPVVRYISQYYEKYGKIIITDPDTADYMFNFSMKYNVQIQEPRQEQEHLMKGLKFLEELFLIGYNDEVKNKHFPYAFILADSIYDIKNDKKVDIYTTSRYIAFLVNDEMLNKSEEEKVQLSRSWNSIFLNYCIAKEGWTAPEEFYPYTDEELKEQETRWFPVEGGTEQAPNPPLSDIYWAKGFPTANWTYNYPPDSYDWDKRVFGYEASSSRSGYLEKFIEFLLTTPQETIDAAIAKHEMLRKAHDVLDNSLKESFGIDYRTMIYKPKK